MDTEIGTLIVQFKALLMGNGLESNMNNFTMVFMNVKDCHIQLLGDELKTIGWFIDAIQTKK